MPNLSDKRYLNLLVLTELFLQALRVCSKFKGPLRTKVAHSTYRITYLRGDLQHWVLSVGNPQLTIRKC